MDPKAQEMKIVDPSLKIAKTMNPKTQITHKSIHYPLYMTDITRAIRHGITEKIEIFEINILNNLKNTLLLI